MTHERYELGQAAGVLGLPFLSGEGTALVACSGTPRNLVNYLNNLFRYVRVVRARGFLILGEFVSSM